MLKGGLWSGFDEWRGRTIRSNYAENKERAKGAAVRLLRNCVLRVIRCETQAAVVQWRCRRYDGALETISEAVREREATLEDEVKRVTKQVYAAGEAAHSGRVGMLETELLQGRQAQMKLEASLKQQIEIVARMETSRWDREWRCSRIPSIGVLTTCWLAGRDRQPQRPGRSSRAGPAGR
eukprot:TRINITY_DN7922_c0_g1_i1.p1 TRINITY_DN7922_c0_g1~~TRINITY_DN7922_c0_g1_i1.p1  ORF type:complete len:180 (-),score=16.60 TRINITY_DN7922_c0_g1_i1:640-1179(-)